MWIIWIVDIQNMYHISSPSIIFILDDAKENLIKTLHVVVRCCYAVLYFVRNNNNLRQTQTGRKP